MPRGDEALLGGEHRNSGELSLPGSLAEREMPFWLRGHLCGSRRVKGAWSSGLMDQGLKVGPCPRTQDVSISLLMLAWQPYTQGPVTSQGLHVID